MAGFHISYFAGGGGVGERERESCAQTTPTFIEHTTSKITEYFLFCGSNF